MNGASHRWFHSFDRAVVVVRSECEYQLQVLCKTSRRCVKEATVDREQDTRCGTVSSCIIMQFDVLLRGLLPGDHILTYEIVFLVDLRCV